MSDEEPTLESETVPVPRLTVATAIDLLRDLESEVERADTYGPYLAEITETIEQLGKSLDES